MVSVFLNGWIGLPLEQKILKLIYGQDLVTRLRKKLPFLFNNNPQRACPKIAVLCWYFQNFSQSFFWRPSGYCSPKAHYAPGQGCLVFRLFLSRQSKQKTNLTAEAYLWLLTVTEFPIARFSESRCFRPQKVSFLVLWRLAVCCFALSHRRKSIQWIVFTKSWTRII